MSDAALKEQFLLYCKQGGNKDKTTLSSQKITRMFKDLGLFNKSLTSNRLDILFSSAGTKGKKEITFDEFKKLLEHKEITDAHPDVRTKIEGGTGPSTAGTTKTSKTGNVAGMTDASKYTGSHKERFDADGKGKGLEGRTEKVNDTGYVGNYKGADTYDQKH